MATTAQTNPLVAGVAFNSTGQLVEGLGSNFNNPPAGAASTPAPASPSTPVVPSTKPSAATQVATLNTLPASGISSSGMVNSNQNSQSAVASATSSIVNPTSGGLPSSSQGYVTMTNGNLLNPATGVIYNSQGQQVGAQSPNSSGSPTSTSGANGALTGTVNAAQGALGAYSTAYQTTLANAGLASQSLQLQYQTQLGSINNQYSQDYTQLMQQHQNAVGNAVATMAASDPFDQGGQSSPYVSKINQMFTQQATFLNNNYAQQQIALTNGDVEGALGIQQDINNAASTFSTNLANLQMGVAQASLNQQNFQQTTSIAQQNAFNNTLRTLDTSQLVATNPDGTINQQQTYSNIMSSPLGQYSTQSGGYIDPTSIYNSVLTGTTAGAQLGISKEQLGISATNAATNQYRAQLQGITTSSSQNTALSAKATQYSQYSDAISGIQSIANNLSNSTFTNTLESYVKSADPSSQYSYMTTLLGQDGMNVLTVANGGVKPDATQLQSLLATATKNGTDQSSLVSNLASQIQNTIENQTKVDSVSPIAGFSPTFVSSINDQAKALSQYINGGTGSAGSSSGAPQSGFAQYLQSQIGGNYNISIPNP